MEKDDTLKQLFEDFAPELNPDKDFMQRLQRKLDAVEFIRQRQKAQMRIYHYGMLATFAFGLIIGGILFTVVMAWPADSWTFAIWKPNMSFAILQNHLREITLSAIGVLTSFCIAVLVVQWIDIASLSLRNKT